MTDDEKTKEIKKITDEYFSFSGSSVTLDGNFKIEELKKIIKILTK
jgi:hypothetical protein